MKTKSPAVTGEGNAPRWHEPILMSEVGTDYYRRQHLTLFRCSVCASEKKLANNLVGRHGLVKCNGENPGYVEREVVTVKPKTGEGNAPRKPKAWEQAAAHRETIRDKVLGEGNAPRSTYPEQELRAALLTAQNTVGKLTAQRDELLAALKAIQNTTWSVDASEMIRLGAIYKKAQAAIAKAEGGAK